MGHNEPQGDRESQGSLGVGRGSVVQMVGNKAHHLISVTAPAAV